MSSRVWFILLLSVSGYVQTMANQNSTDADCATAVDSLRPETTADYIDRLFSAFPSLAAAIGMRVRSLNPLTAAERGFPADHDNATVAAAFDILSPREAMDEFCLNVNKTAQAVAKVVERCSNASRECPSGFWRMIPFTPDVLWAVAELCTSSRAVDYLNTLGHCHAKIVRQPSFGLRFHADQELTDSEENPKIACFLSYGRKFVCRYMQMILPELNQRSGNNILETCGQQADKLALEFQQDAMRVLRCSEFGDFVRTFDWLSVNYRANGSAH